MTHHPSFVVRLVLDCTDIDECADDADALDFMLYELAKRPHHSATVLLRDASSRGYVRVADRGTQLDAVVGAAAPSPSLAQWLAHSMLWHAGVVPPAQLFECLRVLFVRDGGCVRLRCDHLGLAVLRLLLDDAARANYLLLPAWRSIVHIV
jgi:hypothetical protein